MDKTEPCPSCGTETPLQKTWINKLGKGDQKRTFRLFLYKCPKCGRSFRKSKLEEEKEEEPEAIEG